MLLYFAYFGTLFFSLIFFVNLSLSRNLATHFSEPYEAACPPVCFAGRKVDERSRKGGEKRRKIGEKSRKKLDAPSSSDV